MSKDKDFDRIDLDKVISQAADMVSGIFGNIRDLKLQEKLKARLDELRAECRRDSAVEDDGGEDPRRADADADPKQDADPRQRVRQPIHRPAHYGSKSGQDVIDVAEDFGIIDNAYKFNMLKYILRGGKKEGNSELEDMLKVQEYVGRYVEKLRGE